MNWLSFISIIFITICVVFCFIGYISTKYDTKRLIEENSKLKDDLNKVRKKKIKNGGKK